MTLKLEDFRNPMFDRQRIVRRKVHKRKSSGEMAFEGTTVTDDFNEVGFTYYLSDGLLSVVNRQNQKLFLGTIASPEDFEKALKKADKKQNSLRK